MLMLFRSTTWVIRAGQSVILLEEEFEHIIGHPYEAATDEQVYRLDLKAHPHPLAIETSDCKITIRAMSPAEAAGRWR